MCQIVKFFSMEEMNVFSKKFHSISIQTKIIIHNINFAYFVFVSLDLYYTFHIIVLVSIKCWFWDKIKHYFLHLILSKKSILHNLELNKTMDKESQTYFIFYLRTFKFCGTGIIKAFKFIVSEIKSYYGWLNIKGFSG